MFHGPITAIVTPFKRGKIDFEAYGKLIEFQIKNGVTGLVACGTTGEASTLSDDEQIEAIAFTVQQAKKRVPVIAGAGSNETAHAVELTRRADKAGADGILTVTPYYNKSTQAGLVKHFTVIAKATKLPVILYNVPSRTGINLLPETAAKLFGVKNIIGIKEASGNLSQSVEILQRTGGKMLVLSGEDPLYLPLLSIGAKGIISVTSNVAPKEMRGLYDAFMKNDIKKARKIHDKLWPVTKALFSEVNPIPVKAAVSMLGLIKEEYRLPLIKMTAPGKKKLRAALVTAGILKG